MASAASTRQLQDIILSASSAGEDPYLTEFRTSWTTSSGLSLPDARSFLKQRSWDEPGLQNDKITLWNSASDDFQKARLAAVSASHSGDWLHARPISSCSLQLENEAIRVAVGLRLGVDLCHPHRCLCGATVDAKSIHELSCKLAAGCMPRHQALKDLIWRALTNAGVSSTKEPSGMSRTDGKRPDGLTLYPMATR